MDFGEFIQEGNPMGYDYEELIKNYCNHTWASNRFHNDEEEADKEIAYITQRLKEKMRSGIVLSYDEICVLFNYELFPYERQEGESMDHGFIWCDYIFDVDEDEHYMFTFPWHDDYGPEWESQTATRCEYREVKKMMWMPVEDDAE